MFLLLGTHACPHWRTVEVNGKQTRQLFMFGGTPQGLGPSPFFYNIPGDGFAGLLATMGILGVNVPISMQKSVSAASTRFADDFAAFIRACHLWRLFDAKDIFCAGSSNDNNQDKTLGFYLGQVRLQLQRSVNVLSLHLERDSDVVHVEDLRVHRHSRRLGRR